MLAILVQRSVKALASDQAPVWRPFWLWCGQPLLGGHGDRLAVAALRRLQEALNHLLGDLDIILLEQRQDLPAVRGREALLPELLDAVLELHELLRRDLRRAQVREQLPEVHIAIVLGGHQKVRDRQLPAGQSALRLGGDRKAVVHRGQQRRVILCAVARPARRAVKVKALEPEERRRTPRPDRWSEGHSPVDQAPHAGLQVVLPHWTDFRRDRPGSRSSCQEQANCPARDL